MTKRTLEEVASSYEQYRHMTYAAGGTILDVLFLLDRINELEAERDSQSAWVTHYQNKYNEANEDAFTQRKRADAYGAALAKYADHKSWHKDYIHAHYDNTPLMCAFLMRGEEGTPLDGWEIAEEALKVGGGE